MSYSAGLKKARLQTIPGAGLDGVIFEKRSRLGSTAAFIGKASSNRF
jgi:hypothetical protein